MSFLLSVPQEATNAIVDCIVDNIKCAHSSQERSCYAAASNSEVYVDMER